MKLAVTDANIFIDLIYIELLDPFFYLDIELFTTVQVIDELHDEQQQKIIMHQQAGRIHIQDFSGKELKSIGTLSQRHRRLSYTDLSVYFLADKLDIGILTSDSLLRKLAQTEKREVHGMLWVMDKMLQKEILTGQTACQKLEHLMEYNKWLPKHECEQMLKKWSLL